MYKFRFIITVLFIPFSVTAYLQLPRSLDSRAVCYVKSRQIPGYCCGYNVLFNACNMSKLFGIPNAQSDFKRFKSICSGYTRAKKINPLDTVSSVTVAELAKKCGVSPFIQLQLNNDYFELLGHTVYYEFSHGASSAEKALSCLKAKKRLLKLHIEEASSYLEQQRDSGRNGLVHIQCCVTSRGESHAVLITIVQNSTGRALYLFDNMNMPVREDSEIMLYIEYLIHMFSISKKDEYKGPIIPSSWPTIPPDAPTVVYS